MWSNVLRARQRHGFVQWSVHWTLSWTTRVLVLRQGQGIVPLRCVGKKMRAPLLGLAKSIY